MLVGLLVSVHTVVISSDSAKSSYENRIEYCKKFTKAAAVCTCLGTTAVGSYYACQNLNPQVCQIVGLFAFAGAANLGRKYLQEQRQLNKYKTE